MTISRRSVIALTVAFGSGVTAWPALANDYPSRPITIIVPAAAGSFTDNTARLIGQRLGERLHQSVVIENKAGGNTIIGAEYLVRQKPDGYTLMLTASTVHAANPSLVKSLPYQPIKDFTPIARVGQVPYVIAVTNSLPVKTLGELIAHAKNHPGKMSFGSPNAGSLVASASIAYLAGIDAVRVNYKSSAQTVTDLIAGHLWMSSLDFVTGIPSVETGKLRALAVTSRAPSPLLPGVPAVSETFPDFDVVSWNGIVGPAGMSRDVVNLLAREINLVLNEQAIQETFASRGVELVPTTSPEQFSQYMEEQIAHWAKLVSQAGLQPE